MANLILKPLIAQCTVFMKKVPAFLTLVMAFGITHATPLHLYPLNSFSKHITVSPRADTLVWETVLDSSSFKNYTAFEAQWNYLYPWGKDHNGSARMYASPTDHSQVTLENSILRLKASYITADEGKSPHNPYEKIRYHAGTVHAKQQITISNKYPVYEVGGYFKAPTTKGTWPAFWLTAVKGWPPETDILEFKGDSLNWQNTFIVPNKANTAKQAIPDAATQWHHYKAVLKKVNATDIDIYYYLDNQLTGVHRCNFMNKPMWLIINLQMEGSSGGPGPQTDTDYFIKEVLVRRSRG